MYGTNTDTGAVLGTATTVASGIVLPNTGSNGLLQFAAIAGLVVGGMILASTIALSLVRNLNK